MRLFAVCPPDRGGHAPLHGLVALAAGLGYDAALVCPGGPGAAPVPARVVRARDAVDAPDSLVVVDARDVALLVPLGLARRAVWWLDVAAVTRATEQHRRGRGGRGPLDVLLDPAAPLTHLVPDAAALTHLRSRGVPATALALPGTPAASDDVFRLLSTLEAAERPAASLAL